MIHPKPAIFFKITPLNPTGMTIVDLGEMDHIMDDIPPASLLARRHSSLPPITETRAHVSHGENSSKGRHRSLPPKTVNMISASPSFEASETDGGETDSVGESDPPLVKKGDNTTRVSCLQYDYDTHINRYYESG
jgi:hypothetical protein